MDCTLDRKRIIMNNDLAISFHRTVRVPDNFQTSQLPPDLGKFPLQRVSEYTRQLGAEMSMKGGLFLPMYQSEAMWIKFESKQTYLVKIYVGGINAVSGEPAVENAASRLRRQTRLAQYEKEMADGGKGDEDDEEDEKHPLQDYVVVPGQLWLDGIASADGVVRQFVATPFGSGHSVEHQITGRDSTGGIQFEVTPYRPPPPKAAPAPWQPVIYEAPEDSVFTKGPLGIQIKLLTGSRIYLWVSPKDTIENLKYRIREAYGTHPDQLRLIFEGRQLEDCRTLDYYDVKPGDKVHMVLRLHGGGGGPLPPQQQMTLGAGGKIQQTIIRDTEGRNWQPSKTTVFNIQILNSAAYKNVTGKKPPGQPIDAEEYAEHGFPCFKMYEEPSGIHGNFQGVKSIGQLTERKDKEVRPGEINIASMNAQTAPVGLVNPQGPLREFRSVHDLADELAQYHIAQF